MIPFTLIVVGTQLEHDFLRIFLHNCLVKNRFIIVHSHGLQIICGECLSVYMSRIKNQSLGTKYVACVYKAVGSYVFGAAASQSLTDIAKYSIGRLRPNFLAVCKPPWDRINCKPGGYIENFTCTGDKFLVDEARYGP